MNNQLEKAETYYKKGKKTTDSVIKADLRGKDLIVYGNQSVNAQLPNYLDTYTEDWDILAKEQPHKVAHALERALDKKYDGDYFYVQPAKHEGTYRVMSRVTKKAVADITMYPKDEKVPTTRKFGINYATLDYQLKNIERSLKDKESAFRHDKDLETKQRIMIYRQTHKSTVSPEAPKRRRSRPKRHTNFPLPKVKRYKRPSRLLWPSLGSRI